MDTPFPSYKGNAPYIFVSYAQDDKKEVFKHIKRLNQEGFRIWYDEGIEPGVNWYASLEERLRGCECILLFMSKHSQESKYISKEITFAIENNKHIVCIMLDNEELKGPFKLMLCDTQSILKDELRHVEEFYSKLKNSLRPDLTCSENDKKSSYAINNSILYKNIHFDITQKKFIVVSLIILSICATVLFLYHKQLLNQTNIDLKPTIQKTNETEKNIDKNFSSLVLTTHDTPMRQRFSSIETVLNEVREQECQFVDFIEQNKQTVEIFKTFVLNIDNIYNYLIDHKNQNLTKLQLDTFLQATEPVSSINKKITDADNIINKLFKKTDDINKKLTNEQKEFVFSHVANFCLIARSYPNLSIEQCIAKYEESYGNKYVFNNIDHKQSILSFFDACYFLNKIICEFQIYYEGKYRYIKELMLLLNKK